MKSGFLYLLWFVIPLVLGITIACHAQRILPPLPNDGTRTLFQPAAKPFYHGVASGDPLADRVIIWTRFTPDQHGPAELRWEMAKDRQFTKIVRSGNTTTDQHRDYTVKVDVTGLAADTEYYYRFRHKKAHSVIGCTKTAPGQDTEQLRLVVVSCSNYEAGFFNAFGRISEKKDIDAVLHLGDYIYEYPPGVYGDSTTGRFHLPPRETVSLSDYRTRYAQYRLDPDLQRAHQMHPFITIWDDHEIANNAYEGGGENHQPEEEGDFNSRKKAAKKAYYEWLPVREQAHQQLYRKLSFGPLVDLFMLDERLAGRSRQVDSFTHVDLNSDKRSMLGKAQFDWFTRELAASRASWKIIGNQVIFSDLRRDLIWPEMPLNLDAWDGYPAEKQRLLDFLHKQQIKDIIFITGDTHCSWAFEVPYDMSLYKDGRTPPLAVEFGATSISSANYDEYRSLDTVRMVEQLYLAPHLNPHLKYVNLSEHGYFLLELNSSQAHGSWYFVDNVTQASPKEYKSKEYWLRKGSAQLLDSLR